jgi:HSP20 family molecular chaperone IbpA
MIRPWTLVDGESKNNTNDGNNNLWRAFQHSDLHFHDDDATYYVSIDLPGVKASDMSLKLEDDGKTIHLSGHRKRVSSDGKSVSESKFVKRFTVGKDVETDKLNANLSDGVLTLHAPKKAPVAPISKEIKVIAADQEEYNVSEDEDVAANHD